MKAAVWHENANELSVEEIPDPALLQGSVLMQVEAAFVPGALADRLTDTSTPGLPPFPHVPGFETVGKIVETADDVQGLQVGELVYCNHWYSSHDLASEPDHCFLGGFGMGPGAAKHLHKWRHGNLAEKLMLPAECVVPLGAAADVATPARLARLGWVGTAYGGLLRIGFQPGETLIVNGATGIVGSSGVLLGLAMGAAKIVAVGRNKELLDRLVAIAPARVVTVQLTGSDDDAQRIKDAADGSADALLDAVGGGASVKPTLAAIGALRQRGRAVLVGAGITEQLSFDYVDLVYREISVMGSLWYSSEAAARMVAMIAAETLDLSMINPIEYKLDDAMDAVRRANMGGLGLDHVVVCP